VYRIIKTKIEGCIELIPNIFSDHRGLSIKPFHANIFRELGMENQFNEDFMVTSKKGVLRGLHFQKTPFEQAKLLYCVKGSIFDVAVDIRKNSPTYGRYVSFNIDSRNHNMAYIPAGFAHGYMSLEDDTVVIYKMSSGYSQNHEGGIRWDSVDIKWPLIEPILSDKDKVLPKFEDFISIF